MTKIKTNKVPAKFKEVKIPKEAEHINYPFLPRTNNTIFGGGFVNKNPNPKKPLQDFSSFPNKQFTKKSVYSVPTNPQFRKLLQKNKDKQNEKPI